MNNAATFLSDRHPLIVLGRQQLEAGRVLREQFKPDDFMSIVIGARCLTIGIYNLVYDPDVEIVAECCETIRDHHERDQNVAVPDHCSE